MAEPVYRSTQACKHAHVPTDMDTPAQRGHTPFARFCTAKLTNQPLVCHRSAIGSRYEIVSASSITCSTSQLPDPPMCVMYMQVRDSANVRTCVGSGFQSSPPDPKPNLWLAASPNETTPRGKQLPPRSPSLQWLPSRGARAERAARLHICFGSSKFTRVPLEAPHGHRHFRQDKKQTYLFRNLV